MATRCSAAFAHATLLADIDRSNATDYSPEGGATLRLGHQQLQHLRLLQVLRAGTDCYTLLTTIRVGATPAPWPPAASTPSPITAPLRGSWPLQHNWWPGTAQYCAMATSNSSVSPMSSFLHKVDRCAVTEDSSGTAPRCATLPPTATTPSFIAAPLAELIVALQLTTVRDGGTLRHVYQQLPRLRWQLCSQELTAALQLTTFRNGATLRHGHPQLGRLRLCSSSRRSLHCS